MVAWADRGAVSLFASAVKVTTMLPASPDEGVMCNQSAVVLKDQAAGEVKAT